MSQLFLILFTPTPLVYLFLAKAEEIIRTFLGNFPPVPQNMTTISDRENYQGDNTNFCKLSPGRKISNRRRKPHLLGSNKNCKKYASCGTGRDEQVTEDISVREVILLKKTEFCGEKIIK